MPAPASRLAPQQVQKQRLALTPTLRQSMELLSLRGMAIARLVKSIADENPYLEVTMPPAHTPGQAGTGPAAGFDHIDNQASHPVSLSAHLFAALGEVVRNADDRAVALALIPHVSPAGWLEESGVALARHMGYDGMKFEALLKTMQSIEPAGLFARNLAECLRLQIDDRDEMIADVSRVLDHLNLLEGGSPDGLVRATGLDEAGLSAVMAVLRRCNPKPGAAFIQDEGDIFRPDLLIHAEGAAAKTFNVMVNQESLPEIRLREEMAADDDAERILRAEAERQMRELASALRTRSEMLLAAGALIISQQQEFLHRGEVALKPLTMVMMADRMGCHKSTISRLVADKLCDTPRGMLALKDFFSPVLKQSRGPDLASRAVAARMIGIIEAEDTDAPLSDHAIAARLAADGISIARRTIAKYREQNNIPTWTQRFQSRSQ